MELWMPAVKQPAYATSGGAMLAETPRYSFIYSFFIRVMPAPVSACNVFRGRGHVFSGFPYCFNAPLPRRKKMDSRGNLAETRGELADAPPMVGRH